MTPTSVAREAFWDPEGLREFDGRVQEAVLDYVNRSTMQDTKRIFNLAFGIDLNIAVVDMELDMSVVLPTVRTTETFEDGIDSFTFLAEKAEEN